MIPRIIGISGAKFSGKSKVASILCDKYDYNIKSFAEPLKLAAKEIFLLDEDQLYDPIKKETIDKRLGISPREIFQVLGTDIFRNNIYNFFPRIKLHNDNIWITNMNLYINKNIDKKIIIDDVRFDDEYNFIKSINGIVIKINRKNNLIIDNHESEIGCKYDFIIDNNSDLIHLEKCIEKFIQEYD